MKTLIKKIEKLTEQIEMGLFTKSEAISRLKELRNKVTERFDEGSDEFTQCIHLIIDANEIVRSL